jgi:putative ABC transport system permease protein
MGLLEAIKLGIENILAHKLRAFLTMLGMVLGVGAVISMLSIGSGAKEEAIQQVEALGINNIWIKSKKPAEAQTKKEEDSQQKGTQKWGLTLKDASHLKNVVPDVAYIIPIKEVRENIWSAQKKIQSNTLAVTPEYQTVMRLKINKGRFISHLDLNEEKNVCILGEEAEKMLFGYYKSALGEDIKIGNNYFHVIGVLNKKLVPKGTLNVNQTVYLPFSTDYRKTVVTYVNNKTVVEKDAEIDEICIQLNDIKFIGHIKQIIDNSLKRLHPQGDYEITVPEELLEKTRQMQRLFNIVMGSIAGISLLVGGVGIMNIMLATVSERTREIGIRRALGARHKDIVKQFLIETSVLTFIGGMIGIGFGIGISKLIPLLAGGQYKTILSPYPVLAAFFISLLLGLIFGMYPAYKAACISPIEALRYE